MTLVALGSGVVLAAIFIAVGAVRLTQTGLAFKKRLEGYKVLPFAPALERTQAKTATLSLHLETAPRTIERAQRAFADIELARTSTVDSTQRAVEYVRGFFTRR